MRCVAGLLVPIAASALVVMDKAGKVMGRENGEKVCQERGP